MVQSGIDFEPGLREVLVCAQFLLRDKPQPNVGKSRTTPSLPSEVIMDIEVGPRVSGCRWGNVNIFRLCSATRLELAHDNRKKKRK